MTFLARAFLLLWGGVTLAAVVVLRPLGWLLERGAIKPALCWACLPDERTARVQILFRRRRGQQYVCPKCGLHYTCL